MRVAVASTSRAGLGVSLALLVALVCGCASGPRSSSRGVVMGDAAGARDSDGPGFAPPADLASRPDAEPRVEPIRSGGANKPYQVLGRTYVPQTSDAPFRQRGLASWYGRKFDGRMTASGERYDMYAMTAAHPTLPIPSYARIRNPANGREVLVRINDRGPFVDGRIVDLSYTAALKLDLLRGVAPVELERITFDDIRAGTWRRGAPADVGDRAAVRLAAAGATPGEFALSQAPVVQVPTRDVALVAQTTTSVPSTAATSAPTARDAQTAQAAPATSVDDSAQVSSPTAASSSQPSAASSETPARADRDGAPPARSNDVGASASDGATPRTGGADNARGFWIQLAAFRQRDGAETFRRRVGGDAAAGWLDPLLTIVDGNAFFRVQAGPYASRGDAEAVAARVRAALAIVPIVVERR